MNTLDVVIILGIGIFVAFGIKDGFSKKIFGIFGFLAGLICSTKFMAFGAEYLMRWFSFGKELSLILSFFTIFILVIILLNLSYRWFGQSGDDTLKYWSRLAGGFLGAAQGAVAVSLALIMLAQFDFPSEETRSSSLLHSTVVRIAPKVFDYLMKWTPEAKKFDDEIKSIRTEIEKYQTP